MVHVYLYASCLCESFILDCVMSVLIPAPMVCGVSVSLIQGFVMCVSQIEGFVVSVCIFDTRVHTVSVCILYTQICDVCISPI